MLLSAIAPVLETDKYKRHVRRNSKIPQDHTIFCLSKIQRCISKNNEDGSGYASPNKPAIVSRDNNPFYILIVLKNLNAYTSSLTIMFTLLPNISKITNAT